MLLPFVINGGNGIVFHFFLFFNKFRLKFIDTYDTIYQYGLGQTVPNIT